MSSFVPVAALEDLDPGTVTAVTVDGVEIALVRDEDGSVHALEDLCSHGEVALSDGEVDNGCLECWKHGSQFDLRTGRPRQLPAVQPVAVFPVQIDSDSGAVSIDITAPRRH